MPITLEFILILHTEKCQSDTVVSVIEMQSITSV